MTMYRATEIDEDCGRDRARNRVRLVVGDRVRYLSRRDARRMRRDLNRLASPGTQAGAQ